ncbi:MAG: MerR family transcriptional regulator [Polyangiaceae bacterium]
MANSNRFHLTVAAPAREADVRAIEAESSPLLDPRELLRVGDLAKLSGKTVRAIHHYEELGLIEPVGRSSGHYRLFDPETLVRIRWINKLKSLGLSLTEIRGLVQLRQSSPSAMISADQLKQIYADKLSEVRQRLSELRELEGELEAALSYLDLCNTLCAPALSPTNCAHCDRHADTRSADLIAGALA